MKKFSHTLVPIFILLITRSWASPFPQDEEKPTNEEQGEDEEEEEEGEDEYYEDEDKGSSTSGPVVVEASAEELDKDDLEDLALRNELSQRLGIKNYTSSALADKATNVVLAFIASRYGKESPKTKPSQKPVKKIRTTTVEPYPVYTTTRKYKILRSTSNPIPREDSLNSADMEATRTFVITVPQDNTGTGGGTIEISIPINMTSYEENGGTHHHLSQMSILGEDEQGVKNIEAVLMEALILAQQMTDITMSTVMSNDNHTETIELDIKELAQITTETMLENLVNITANATTESPKRSEAEDSSLDQKPKVTSKPKPSKLASTTPKGPKIPDPLGLGPLTDVFVSQIRSGKLPTFVWGSIVKLASSKYAQIAVDAVECAVFYYCPDDTELGTLSEGGKF